MPTPAYVPEATVWTDRPRLSLAQAVVDRLADRVKLIAVGGPREAGLNRFAEARDLPHHDDPRRLVVEHPAAYLLLITLDQWSKPALAAALAQGTIVLTLEPLAADLRELRALGDMINTTASSDKGTIIDVPRFAAMPGWTSAADPLSALGAVRSVAFLSFFHAEECSLFSRLFDAWRFVIEQCAMPESIDASIAATGLDPGDDLRAMTGHVTAHGRWADAAGVVLQLSDGSAAQVPGAKQAAAPTEVNPFGGCDSFLHVAGDAGRLRVTIHDYELYDLTGKLIDRAPPTGMPPGFAEMIITQWSQLLRQLPRVDAGEPQRAAVALACCQATLLSARTGQPESPQRLLEVGGWK